MGLDRYCIITNGEVAPGFTEGEVRANIRTLCKYRNEETLESIFSGKDFVFKSDLDQENAQKYQAALAKTGIICRPVKIFPTSVHPISSFDKSLSSSTESTASSLRQEGSSACSVMKGKVPILGFFSKKRMGVIVGILGLLVVTCFAIVFTLHAKGYPGVWSNQKGEFKTLTISLRKDGRGTFSTAIFSVPLRWEKKDNGIQVKATLNGDVSEIFFLYDSEKNTFTVKGAGAESANVLKKVSNDEPPDIEAEIIQRAEKEQEKFKAEHKMETTTFTSRTALIADLANRIRGFEGNGIFHVYVRPLDKKWQFIITYVNHNLGGTVVTDWKSVEKPNSTLKSSRMKLPKPPDLPTRYQMSDATRIALVNKLTEGQYQFTTETIVGRSLWAVESYMSELHFIHPDTDRAKMIGIVEYLVNEAYGEWSGPYEVSR